MPSEGRFVIVYQEVAGSFEDGLPYRLRVPSYRLEEIAFGPMPPDVMLSPRIAPAVVGMGLLESIPPEAILALADPDDADGDGISGRANLVWDIRQGRQTIGRFGWKASQPAVEQQTAGAFLNDIGITSALFPDEN